MRRAGRVNEFVSAYVSASNRAANIATDAGRVCRCGLRGGGEVEGYAKRKTKEE